MNIELEMHNCIALDGHGLIRSAFRRLLSQFFGLEKSGYAFSVASAGDLRDWFLV